MHVGIVSPCSSGPLADLLPESGGVDLGCGAHFITTLVRALINRGHDLSVVTLSPNLTERVILKGRNLTYYVYPMRTQRRMRDLYRLEREGLRDGILRAKPDVLHAHWTYEFALACFETGFPTLVTSHDNAFQQLRFGKDLYRLGRLYIQLQVVRKARFLTAVSPYLARSLQWLAKAEIEIIPNPVTVPATSQCRVDRTSRPVRIATVLNGWGIRKNAKSAMQAFSILRRELPDSEMFMYGSDFEKGGIAAQWAAANGLSENITFRGFLAPHELKAEMKEMTLLLHPALEEACPLALLEAMSLRLPIVAGSDAGGVPWVLDNGRGGFLTDVRTPARIAEALIECITKDDVRERKQQHAFDTVLNVFSPESVARQYENAYERALGR